MVRYRTARSTDGETDAIKEAAKQFESLFMRELIKSMREATMKSGLLDSAQGDLSTDLLDQQLSVQMSGMPGGLSEQIARPLSQRINGNDAASAVHAPSVAPSADAAPLRDAEKPVTSGDINRMFAAADAQTIIANPPGAIHSPVPVSDWPLAYCCRLPLARVPLVPMVAVIRYHSGWPALSYM